MKLAEKNKNSISAFLNQNRCAYGKLLTYERKENSFIQTFQHQVDSAKDKIHRRKNSTSQMKELLPPKPPIAKKKLQNIKEEPKRKNQKIMLNDSYERSVSE